MVEGADVAEILCKLKFLLWIDTCTLNILTIVNSLIVMPFRRRQALRTSKRGGAQTLQWHHEQQCELHCHEQ